MPEGATRKAMTMVERAVSPELSFFIRVARLSDACCNRAGRRPMSETACQAMPSGCKPANCVSLMDTFPESGSSRSMSNSMVISMAPKCSILSPEACGRSCVTTLFATPSWPSRPWSRPDVSSPYTMSVDTFCWGLAVVCSISGPSIASPAVLITS